MLKVVRAVWAAASAKAAVAYGALVLLGVGRILLDRRRAGAVGAFGRQWRRHAVAGTDAA